MFFGSQSNLSLIHHILPFYQIKIIFSNTFTHSTGLNCHLSEKNTKLSGCIQALTTLNIKLPEHWHALLVSIFCQIRFNLPNRLWGLLGPQRTEIVHIFVIGCGFVIWKTHRHLGSEKTPQPVKCWFFDHLLGRLSRTDEACFVTLVNVHAYVHHRILKKNKVTWSNCTAARNTLPYTLCRQRVKHLLMMYGCVHQVYVCATLSSVFVLLNTGATYTCYDSLHQVGQT